MVNGKEPNGKECLVEINIIKAKKIKPKIRSR